MVWFLKKVVAAIRTLSWEDFYPIATTVLERIGQERGELSVRERSQRVERCPHCSGQSLGKWGVDRQGLQHFKCKECGCYV